jgi:hypothetical protein
VIQISCGFESYQTGAAELRTEKRTAGSIGTSNYAKNAAGCQTLSNSLMWNRNTTTFDAAADGSDEVPSRKAH